MAQGTMDNDTNLNAVVRHMWSMNSLTKVVAQVNIIAFKGGEAGC